MAFTLLEVTTPSLFGNRSTRIAGCISMYVSRSSRSTCSALTSLFSLPSSHCPPDRQRYPIFSTFKQDTSIRPISPSEVAVGPGSSFNSDDNKGAYLLLYNRLS